MTETITDQKDLIHSYQLLSYGVVALAGLLAMHAGVAAVSPEIDFAPDFNNHFGFSEVATLADVVATAAVVGGAVFHLVYGSKRKVLQTISTQPPTPPVPAPIIRTETKWI